MQNQLNEDFFEKLQAEIDSCEKPYERARLRMEFIKLVVPKPVEEKEDETLANVIINSFSNSL